MKWPDFLQRKEILFSAKVSREEATRWGDRYLELGRLDDAVAFYRRAEQSAGLERIRELAVGSGDYLLFRQAAEGVLPVDDQPGVLRELARRAEALGRWHDARKAYERLGDEEGAQRAKEAWAGVTRGPSAGREDEEPPGGGAGSGGARLSGQPGE